MQKEPEYSVSYKSNGEEVEGYSLVQGDVGVTTTHLPGMWTASTTIQSDVYLAYSIKGSIPSIEESSQKLYDILHGLSSAMGVWESEDDEDL